MGPPFSASGSPPAILHLPNACLSLGQTGHPRGQDLAEAHPSREPTHQLNTQEAAGPQASGRGWFHGQAWLSSDSVLSAV